MVTISTAEKLQERIKELSCLYQISTVLLNGDSMEEKLRQIILVVKQAWRFCDEAIVELQFNDLYLLSDPLPQQTVFQRATIFLPENNDSFIKVHYDAGKFTESHFLNDEFQLLTTVASEIARFHEISVTKEQVQQLQSGLRRVDRLSILGEITAGIAHELNTPLGTILGFAELIKTRSKDQQIIRDIDKVINASIFSREIVKKLMFFSCEMPYNMESIPLKPTIDQALQFLEPNFRKAGVSYTLAMENEQLQAQIDGVQFTQILFNLLVNAIYVAPVGSEIKIAVTHDDHFYWIEIADEGLGIPESNHEKIFEPFFTTKPFGEGTGLGLSVVHGIIKSHQGEITTFANQPQGTVFKIKLPILSQP